MGSVDVRAKYKDYQLIDKHMGKSSPPFFSKVIYWIILILLNRFFKSLSLIIMTALYILES